MEKKGIKISDKQIKIIAVVTILVIIFVVLFWGMVPGKIYEVSEILEKPLSFDSKHVNVSGVVSNWNSESNNFTLVDPFKENYSIGIKHNRGFPGGFGNNETVVVTGIFYSNTIFIEFPFHSDGTSNSYLYKPCSFPIFMFSLRQS